jgi:hypothetical protein
MMTIQRFFEWVISFDDGGMPTDLQKITLRALGMCDPLLTTVENGEFPKIRTEQHKHLLVS